MKDAQIPCLKKLTINFQELSDSEPDPNLANTFNTTVSNLFPQPVIDLIECDGVPFSLIETLSIGFDWRISYDVTMNNVNWDGYHELLRLCRNLKKVSADQLSVIFILRLLKEDCLTAGDILGRHFAVSNGFKSREMRAGKDERLYDVEAFAVELG
jgi:hypothetical protein